MSFSQIIKTFDIFAPIPGLNVDGQMKYKSKTGACFTLVYLTILLTVVGMQISKLFDKSSPITSSENLSQAPYPRVNLSQHKIIPSIIGFSDAVTPISLDRVPYYVTIQAYQIKWKKQIDPKTKKPVTQKLFEKIDLIPCRELNDKDSKVFSYFNKSSASFNLLMQYGMCVDATNPAFYVNGDATSDLWEQVSLFLKPCSQIKEFMKENFRNDYYYDCASMEQVNTMNFVFGTPHGSYDASNYEEPMTLFPNFDDYFYMSYDSTQLYSVKVGQTDIFNLEGPINKWVKGQEVFQIESHMMSLANRPNSYTTCTPEDVKDFTSEVKCSSYFIYTIQSSSQKTVKKRSYTTLIDALGSVGGINGILMLFCGILYSNINLRKRNMYLVNNVYPLLFKTKKQIEEQKRQDEMAQID